MIVIVGIHNNNPGTVQIGPPLQTFLNIVCHRLFCGTAVLFGHGHLSVNNLDTGVQLQKISSQRRYRGTAATLLHVIQTIQNETHFHPSRQVLQQSQNLRHRLSRFRRLSGSQNQRTMSNRQVFGAEHKDLRDLLRCQLRVLMTAGKAHANIHMDDSIILFNVLPEQSLIVRDVHRIGGSNIAAGVYVSRNIRCTDVHAVAVQPVTFYNAQRNHRNIMLFQQPHRQITGTVGSDFDHIDLLP